MPLLLTMNFTQTTMTQVGPITDQVLYLVR